MGHQTVVVGYDGSADADRALDAAADQVGPGGTVHVVTATHPEAAARIADHLRQLPQESREAYEPDAPDHARQQVALLRLQGRGVDCEGHLVVEGTIPRPRSSTSPSARGPTSSWWAAVVWARYDGSCAAASPPGSPCTPR